MEDENSSSKNDKKWSFSALASCELKRMLALEFDIASVWGSTTGLNEFLGTQAES